MLAGGGPLEPRVPLLHKVAFSIIFFPLGICGLMSCTSVIVKRPNYPSHTFGYSCNSKGKIVLLLLLINMICHFLSFFNPKKYRALLKPRLYCISNIYL